MNRVCFPGSFSGTRSRQAGKKAEGLHGAVFRRRKRKMTGVSRGNYHPLC